MHILLHGIPILEYESLKELFLLLKVKNTSLKHWSDSSGKQFAKGMHNVVLSKAILDVSKINYVVVNANEMILLILKNGSISIYVMKIWKFITIMFTFEKVEVGATLDKIKGVILDAMASKYIAFDLNAIQWLKAFGLK
jgi:hypothetical protein